MPGVFIGTGSLEVKTIPESMTADAAMLDRVIADAEFSAESYRMAQTLRPDLDWTPRHLTSAAVLAKLYLIRTERNTRAA